MEVKICFSVQVDKDIKKLSRQFNAEVSVTAYESFSKLKQFENSHSKEDIKAQLGLKRKPSSNVFKEADDKGRIYPGYFAPVIVHGEGKRIIKPMRYRVRPANSAEEIPSK